MSIGRVPGDTGIQPSIVDAKGDLIVATAADSVSRLAVGANDTMLVADSSTATGLAYKTAATLYPLTSYTPVVAQNGTRTATVTYAKYQRIGNRIYVQVLLTITQAGTANNIISVSLPENLTPNNNELTIGSFMYKDTGTAFYAGVVNSLAPGTVAFTVHNAGAFLGESPNFATANNDVISFTAAYEVA